MHDGPALLHTKEEPENTMSDPSATTTALPGDVTVLPDIPTETNACGPPFITETMASGAEQSETRTLFRLRVAPCASMTPKLSPVEAVNDESVIDAVDVRCRPPSVVPEFEVNVQRSMSTGVVLYTALPCPPTCPSNVESATSVS